MVIILHTIMLLAMIFFICQGIGVRCDLENKKERNIKSILMVNAIEIILSIGEWFLYFFITSFFSMERIANLLFRFSLLSIVLLYMLPKLVYRLCYKQYFEEEKAKIK